MSEPRAFFAIDHGAATASVALIGHVGGAWRLVGALALPAHGDVDAVAELLRRRTIGAASTLATALGIDRLPLGAIPRLEVRSQRPRRLAVVAVSGRSRTELVAVAGRSGWRVSSASMDTTDPLAMSRLLLDHEIEAILVGSGDPPAPDERASSRELTALVAAAARRRPELPVVLAGAMAEGLSAFGDVGTRAGEILLGPAAVAIPARRTTTTVVERDPLAELLLELAMPADDPKRAIGPATQAMADVLDRRVETIVLGHDAGVRATASPSAGGIEATPELSVVPAAAVAPDDPDDELVDGVLVWSTVVSDRHRLRDRMRELRIAPWADAAGEGTALRMAASRAALGRLVAATTPRAPATPPDVVVTAGGVWSSVPAPAVALALVDVLRRPGASQFALDHARLLGPLGAIPDPGERLAVMADLIDDLLVPLGSVVTPAGLRAGRSAGTLAIHTEAGVSDLDLVPGGLELVDLPPGATAVAEFKFRDAVRLGTRGKHFAVDVAGGLGGLLVDLRDVPLRLPERADRRRDLLAAWQTALWAGGDP